MDGLLKLILIIGTGGFIGTVLRFLLGRFIQQHVLSPFPYGTFIINVLGCFLIGIFYGISEKGNIMNAEWRLFLTVGFCGGFTTFSAFANENIALLRDGEFFFFALYTALSVFLGLLATYLGSILIKII
jgi:CrcB protein